MPNKKEVRITKDGQEGYCLPSSVAMWERNGWTREDDGSSQTENSPEPAQANQTEEEAS